MKLGGKDTKGRRRISSNVVSVGERGVVSMLSAVMLDVSTAGHPIRSALIVKFFGRDSLADVSM